MSGWFTMHLPLACLVYDAGIEWQLATPIQNYRILLSLKTQKTSLSSIYCLYSSTAVLHRNRCVHPANDPNTDQRPATLRIHGTVDGRLDGDARPVLGGGPQESRGG